MEIAGIGNARQEAGGCERAAARFLSVFTPKERKRLDLRCGSESAPKSTPKVCTRDFWPDLQPGPSRLLSSRAESGLFAPPSIRLHLLYLMVLTVRSSSDTPRLHAYSPESSQLARHGKRALCDAEGASVVVAQIGLMGAGVGGEHAHAFAKARHRVRP